MVCAAVFAFRVPVEASSLACCLGAGVACFSSEAAGFFDSLSAAVAEPSDEVLSVDL